MDWTQDQIAAIIGLRMQLAQALAKLKENEDGLRKDADTGRGNLAAIEGGKGQDDRAGNA